MIHGVEGTIENDGNRENVSTHAMSLESIHAYALASHPKVSSLYIHIPFCAKKCSYCDFFSVRYDESVASAYTDALCSEMLCKSRHAGTLETIYIGGGTPTLLPEKSLEKIFETLRGHFRISADCEITCEANPGTLHEPTVRHLVSLGVNRISLGVQSLVDDELRLLGRIHRAHDATRALSILHNSEIRNYSVDLMYGIPGQTCRTWHETLAKVLRWLPPHISAYELTFEPGTPLAAAHEKPPEDLVIDLYDHAIDCLNSHGYEHYEISNFARAGLRCRHNLNYWDRGEYIGVGAGAHSYIHGIRSRNTDDINDYLSRMDTNALPERETAIISRDEAMREFLMLGLRKTDGIDVRRAQALGVDIVRAAETLCDEGYLEHRAGSIRCTAKGRLLANAVLIALFEQLAL